MAPNPMPTLSEDTRLVDDLGYHSLALLELAFALEEEFGLPAMDAGQAQGIITMLDVEQYVLAQSKPGLNG
jgi:acyl carrier protein